jgi:hypothetical protein
MKVTKWLHLRRVFDVTLGVAVLLVAPAAGAAPVEVQRSGDCPSAAEVSRRLARLLPDSPVASRATGAHDPSEEGGGRDVAILESDEGGGLRLQLRSPASATDAVRRIAAGPSCEQLAALAAVVIAAWETNLAPARLTAPRLASAEVPPERPARATLEPARPTATVRPATEARPIPAATLAAAERPGAAERSLARPATAGVVRQAPPPSRLKVELDAAFVSSLAGAAFAPGAAADVTLSHARLGLGGRLGVRGFGTRTLALGTGSFSWTRVSLALGLAWRRDVGRVRLDLHAELSPALVLVAGAGLADAHQAYDLDLGLGGGLRVGVRAGPVTPFIGAALVGWLREEQVLAINVQNAVSLPRFELLLSAGLAFGVGR